MSGRDGVAARLAAAERRALWIGAGALVLSSAGGVFTPGHFLHAYLMGFLFWTGLALGCAGLLMLYHLVGGDWGFVIRRLLEAGTRALPLNAVLALPLILAAPRIYPWAAAAGGESHGALGHKQAYLNVPFFAGRTAFYFAAWLGLAYVLNKWSLEQDRTGDPTIRRRFQAASGPGLVLFGLTMTFAAVDWIMSLEPEWYSTVYGALFIVGSVLTTLAFAASVVVRLSTDEPFAGRLSRSNLHDLGNLMLAFVMLWAYLGFSQFLIIWAGNLPEEITWYRHRLAGGWQWVAIVLVLFHFALPFVLLLARDVKRRAGMMSRLAAAVLVMRLVDLYWLVEPAFHRGAFALHWLDVTTPVGIGGIWLAVYLRLLRGRPLLALHGAPETAPAQAALEGGARHG